MVVEPVPDRYLDVRQLLCPLPIIRAEAAMTGMATGAVLAICATDPGLSRDLPAWCAVNGHQFLGIKIQGRELMGWVAKG